ncbi:hypothetical protein Mapa_003258 [Marchantia paleacea]|nr:hypothetical protein Mapa_003258 [Marchantia paleacea]
MTPSHHSPRMPWSSPSLYAVLVYTIGTFALLASCMICNTAGRMSSAQNRKCSCMSITSSTAWLGSGARSLVTYSLYELVLINPFGGAIQAQFQTIEKKLKVSIPIYSFSLRTVRARVPNPLSLTRAKKNV